MKVFFDTEFIAGFHKPYFGKNRHFIDLISIGLIDDSGREYYAISKDFNPSDADDWVKSNVLQPIIDEFIKSEHNEFIYKNLWRLDGKTVVGKINLIQKWIGKPNKQIADEIRRFVYGPAVLLGDSLGGIDEDIDGWLESNQIEFYGYYADYDWVLFCSLFGRMIDLPKGFPMYCRDLKQLMDEKGLTKEWKQTVNPDPDGEHNALVDARWNCVFYKLLIAQNDKIVSA